jgi:hypothetical protein
MLMTITTIAGFSVGSLLILLAIGFSIYGRTFGRDSLFMIAIGTAMIALATWEVTKPNYEEEAGYVPWDAPVKADGE